MKILVDSSVWIDYWRGNAKVDKLDFLIDENLIVTNELILAELIPFITVAGRVKLASFLKELPKQQLLIDWQGINSLQINCLRNGHNGIGIPDLILAQHAIQHNSSLYTTDKHFKFLSQITSLELFE